LDGWSYSDGQRHSGAPAVQLLRAAGCDTEHHLIVRKVKERLVVKKQISHIFHMGRFNLKKLNEVVGKE
jgi:hypothetical protein